MCKQAPETRTHFLMSCPALTPCRAPCMNELSDIVKGTLGVSLSDCAQDDVVLMILDIQKFVTQTGLVHVRGLEEIETVARQLCYRQYNERWNLLGRLPRRNRGRKKPPKPHTYTRTKLTTKTTPEAVLP